MSEPGAAGEERWVTPAPPRPWEIVRRIVLFPATLVVHRDLVGTSVMRELRGRFTGTVLGMAWPLLHPIFLFLVYYFIFTKLLAFKMPSLPPGQESAMGVFMFCGIVCWAAFAESVTRGCTVVVENGHLIKKLVFPSELLPLNVVLVGAVTMSFGVLAFVVACYLTPIWTAPDPALLLWTPVLLALQVLFSYGLALILASLHVFMRDTAQVVTVAVTIWMFVTPLFWHPKFIDAETIEPYLGLVEGNPMYHLVYAWRWVLMSAEPEIIFETGLGRSIAIFAVWAIAVFAAGYGFFISTQRHFSDEV